MKRIFLLMLVCFLLLGSLSHALATQSNTFLTDGSVNIQNAVYDDGYFYGLSEKGYLFCYDVKNNESRWLLEPEENSYSYFDVLFLYQDILYGLNVTLHEAKPLWDLANSVMPDRDPLAINCDLLIEKDGEYSYSVYVKATYLQDDYLYFVAEGYMPTYHSIIGALSLTGGENKVFQTEHIASLSPIGDGTFLALLMDQEQFYTAYDPSEISASYGIFDPQTDTLLSETPLVLENPSMIYQLSSLCYADGTIYYVLGGNIMSIDMATGAQTLCAYTGQAYLDISNMIIADHYAVMSGYNGVRRYLLNSPELEKGALRIYGEYGSEAHQSYLREHPEAVIDLSVDEVTTSDGLLQTMISGNCPYDVLILSYQYQPVQKLMEKGFCVDLSVDPTIKETIDSMYPHITAPFQMDGHIYAVPVEMWSSNRSIAKYLWEDLGLTEEDIPTDFLSYLDFVQNWMVDYGEDNPDIALFDVGPSKSSQFQQLFSFYTDYQQSQGDLRFDTPLFRELLTAFEAIDFDEIDAQNPESQNEDFFWSQESLFMLGNSVTSFDSYAEAYQMNMYLSMEEGGDPFLPMSMQVMIINPKTTRMEEALRYVSFYISHLDSCSSNITFFPDHNDPVEDPYYQSNVDSILLNIEQMEDMLQSISAEDKPVLEEDIRWAKEHLLMQEEYRYVASAERILFYRENVAPYLYPSPQNIFSSSNQSVNAEFQKLTDQYLQGAIDQDRFIQEMDSRLRLMQLEDQ